MPEGFSKAAVDNTEANANMDFSAHQEMLKGLTTTLPITDEEVTLTYFMGFESNSLNYIEGMISVGGNKGFPNLVYGKKLS